MNALRERNRLRREAWLDKKRDHNRDEQNWRRGVNGVENAHPYARNRLNYHTFDGIIQTGGILADGTQTRPDDGRQKQHAMRYYD